MAPPSIEDVAAHATSDTETVVIPDILTCAAVPARRSKSAKFNGGIAAYTTSDFYKTPAPWKPLAKKWDHRLTEESASRTSTVLKSLAVHLTTPGMISLGGGLPSSEYFPFGQMDVQVPAVAELPESTMQIGKHDVSEGKSAFDASIALNYGQATGSAQILRWITEHTEIVHNPPYRDWQCLCSAGSTSSLEMVFRMFLNRGDFLISEEYTFATAIETARPLGCKVAGVKMDAQGMLPDALDELVTNWDESVRKAPRPFVVYLVPSGHNPTGATQGTDRRKEIYKVAQKHDLLIIEDEPYYFLQMQPYAGLDAAEPPLPKTPEEFISSLIPSLLSMDVDGRVVRLDSFSKVLAPGSRLGWIVASAQICERFQRHNEVSVQHPSGFSQLILHRLLDETWGHEGYLKWLIHIRGEYTQRRNVMLHACEEFLPADICSWDPPAAGMFHWIKVKVEKHPRFGKSSMKSIEDEIFSAAVGNGVLVTPGSFFLSDENQEQEHLFFRATFAAAEFGAMKEAIRRFGLAVRKSFGLSDE